VNLQKHSFKTSKPNEILIAAEDSLSEALRWFKNKEVAELLEEELQFSRKEGFPNKDLPPLH